MGLKSYKSVREPEPCCGAVFMTNFTIFWLCACLIMELITLGTNEWYVKDDDVIKYWHGGLWNICLGKIDRTFCSYIRETPGWLKATQSLLMVALGSMFVNIVYIMVGVARKRLRISVMFGFINITTLFFMCGVLVYTFCGYSKKITPSKTFYIAWATVAIHLLASILGFVSFLKVSKLSKKLAVENGLKL